MENKTIKQFDFLYSFPDDVYIHIVTGDVFTPQELDARYPTNKDLQVRQTIDGTKSWLL